MDIKLAQINVNDIVQADQYFLFFIATKGFLVSIHEISSSSPGGFLTGHSGSLKRNCSYDLAYVTSMGISINLKDSISYDK